MRYRLIEETETYQITYDDGPRSRRFPDVVSSTTRVLEEWSGNDLTKDEVLTKSKEYLDYYLRSALIEKGTSFYLEYRENDASKWKFVSRV